MLVSAHTGGGASHPVVAVVAALCEHVSSTGADVAPAIGDDGAARVLDAEGWAPSWNVRRFRAESSKMMQLLRRGFFRQTSTHIGSWELQLIPTNFEQSETFGWPKASFVWWIKKRV